LAFRSLMTTFRLGADLAGLLNFFDDLFTGHPLFAPVYGQQCTFVKKNVRRIRSDVGCACPPEMNRRLTVHRGAVYWTTHHQLWVRYMPEHEFADPFARTMSRGVFEVRGRVYTLGHVFCAAEFGGWAGKFWTDLHDALACAAYAMDEGFEVDTAELQSSADQFRYQRRLVTAEETELWLSERDLSEDDLIGYLERRYWHGRFSQHVRGMQESYAPTAQSTADALWSEVIFSDCLGPLTSPLAWRVVAGMAEEAGGLPSAPNELAAFFERAGCGPEGLEGWLGRARCTMEWFHELLILETRYLRACDHALSPERCAAALDARRLDLIRIRFQTARFPTESRAREAHLCIAEDGEEYMEAVRRAGVHAETQVLLLEDAPESLRRHLLSAAQGEVVMVAEPENGPVIIRIIEKTPPKIADPEVRTRLGPALILQYFEPLVEANVHWSVPLEPSQ